MFSASGLSHLCYVHLFWKRNRPKATLVSVKAARIQQVGMLSSHCKTAQHHQLHLVCALETNGFHQYGQETQRKKNWELATGENRVKKTATAWLIGKDKTLNSLWELINKGLTCIKLFVGICPISELFPRQTSNSNNILTPPASSKQWVATIPWSSRKGPLTDGWMRGSQRGRGEPSQARAQPLLQCESCMLRASSSSCSGPSEPWALSRSPGCP